MVEDCREEEENEGEELEERVGEGGEEVEEPL